MPAISRRTFLRIGAAGALGAGLAHVRSTAEEQATFAVLNDIHIKDAASVDILDEAVVLLNKDERVQFTCVLGDLATDGKPEELALAKTALEKLNKPCFVVPGNHDVFLRSDNIYAHYMDAFGPVHWHVEQSGWYFIGFNSCEGVKSDVTVANEELAWLKACIAEINPKQPIALFCHHPLNPNTKAYRIQNAEDILALFAGHTLKIAAAGHWHGNQVEEKDGVIFATTACCATTRGNFDETPGKGYRLFHLQAETLATEFVTVRA